MGRMSLDPLKSPALAPSTGGARQGVIGSTQPNASGETFNMYRLAGRLIPAAGSWMTNALMNSKFRRHHLNPVYRYHTDRGKIAQRSRQVKVLKGDNPSEIIRTLGERPLAISMTETRTQTSNRTRASRIIGHPFLWINDRRHQTTRVWEIQTLFCHGSIENAPFFYRP